MSDLHQSHTTTDQKPFLSNNGIIIFLALIKLSIHFITNALGGYGYFRDELYYLACSDHLALGYVDQPPFSIVMLWISRFLFGDSLFALRILPAVTGAAVVLLTGLITCELGGKRFAQILAATAAVIAPIYLGMNNYFSMNSFDIFFWTLAVYLLVKIIKNNQPRLWIWLGVVLGIGLENKISVLWLCAGIVAGLLLTSARKYFRTKELWFGILIAAFLFHSYITWEFHKDWPTLEFMRNATSGKYAERSPLSFILEQIRMMHPLTFIIWVTGLVALFVSKSVKQFRLLGIIYVTVFLILIFNTTSKAEYLAAAYPMLFAAGAVVVDNFLTRRVWSWVKAVVIILLLAGGAAVAPIVLPILPVETYIGYAKKLGVQPSTTEKKNLGKLPQHFADMFGWENMAATVARTYDRLSPEDQLACAIFCQDYGQAGAIDFFGKNYHLPNAICSHNNYWFWGPGSKKGGVVIVIGGNKEQLQQRFASVEVADTIRSEYVMPYENNLPLHVCRNIKTPIDEIWKQIKHFE